MRIPTGKLGSDSVAKREGKGGVSHDNNIVVAMVQEVHFFSKGARCLCAVRGAWDPADGGWTTNNNNNNIF